MISRVNSLTRKLHRSIGATVLAFATLVAPTAHAQGIPVIDFANLVNALQQLAAWQQQYQQMITQLQQGQSQVNALTGARNLGDILNDPLLQQVVPPNTAQLYAAVQNGGFDNLHNAARTVRLATMLYNCEDRYGEAKKLCQAALNSNAQTIALQQNAMDLITQRVTQIQALQNRINTTQDPKAIAELQARIQSESAQVTNDANRISLMEAMAKSQQQATDQALKERTLRMLSVDAPSVTNTFTFR